MTKQLQPWKVGCAHAGHIRASVRFRLLSLGSASPNHSSPLIQFIRGEGKDHRGRTLDEVLAMDDFWLEHTHDYVQWLFPLPEPSRANPMAPVLTMADIERFRKDSALREQHREALDRMLRFFGLIRRRGLVEPLHALNPKEHIWLKAGGHNHLRITRIIRSFHYCQQPVLARRLQSAFISIGQSQGYVGEQTIGYWLRATD
ncbi:opioid growth factor receptor-related protein [Marinobacter sp. DY40_1A1]|uniref:opioid growth factor receptor-related protein n=1 Tax=Marinobacter sp. DY40_1A1 TaxID=2583229 RepID=UPI0019087AB6|nr:opioid growth factor receptor-related protein [Marinobacter sp. DY40_1A1]MBK1887778.1 hypothetical protein [Marinobacter sp. DY40_1A1]